MIKHDYSKLNGKIVEVFGSQKQFSKAFGRSERTVSLKLNDKIPFDQNEIEKIISLLGIDCNDVPAYFFTQKFN